MEMEKAERGLGTWAQRDALRWKREATKWAPKATAAQFQLAAASGLKTRDDK